MAGHGDRFLTALYTPRELTVCCGRAESLAGRFAAKEAVAKALGTGIWRHGVAGPTSRSTGSRRRDDRCCTCTAAARRADALGLREWSLSISHDRSRAIAFVVALG
ncbi:MAG: 4'-phosphopantetheinyl transferase superfamily protein [Caldilineaceae bacterium]